MNIIPSEIGHRIRSERLRLHYTQEAFSELLSIGRVHLANIEAGRKMASIDLLVAISETSGCSLDYLVLGKTKDSIIKDQLCRIIYLLQMVYIEL